VLRPEIFDEFRQATVEEAPEGELKEFLWYLWRGVALVGMFLIVAVAVMLWFVFHVVFAAWRDPKG
jgi:hypothetical protein